MNPLVNVMLKCRSTPSLERCVSRNLNLLHELGRERAAIFTADDYGVSEQIKLDRIEWKKKGFISEASKVSTIIVVCSKTFLN